MRVLHVSQPVDAGVAAVALMLAADQRARGWDARIACPRGQLVDRAVAASVPVHTWEATRGPGRSVPSEARALGRLVAKHAPDVVHLHSSKAGLAGRLAVRGRRPTIFQPHAWSFDAVGGTTATAARVWESVGGRWADRLLCVSDDELRLGRDAGRAAPRRSSSRTASTPTASPHARPPRPASNSTFRTRRWSLCLGRVTEQKGQDLLLAAWPRVRERVPDARLVIVGDGPRAAEWRAACTDLSVLWRGGTDDPAPWYAAADVVALPSRWEGMPLVALEALSSGRAVAGFGVTGVREAVGEAGAVVAPGDTDALAEAIAARLHPGGPAAVEGAAGRARAVDLFDRKRAADAVADVVEELHRGTERGER